MHLGQQSLEMSQACNAQAGSASRSQGFHTHSGLVARLLESKLLCWKRCLGHVRQRKHPILDSSHAGTYTIPHRFVQPTNPKESRRPAMMRTGGHGQRIHSPIKGCACCCNPVFNTFTRTYRSKGYFLKNQGNLSMPR